MNRTRCYLVDECSLKSAPKFKKKNKTKQRETDYRWCLNLTNCRKVSDFSGLDWTTYFQDHHPISWCHHISSRTSATFLFSFPFYSLSPNIGTIIIYFKMHFQHFPFLWKISIHNIKCFVLSNQLYYLFYFPSPFEIRMIWIISLASQ